MLYHLNYSIIVMTRDIYQSNICDPSWQINHLGTTLQSRLAHRLAYRQLLMSRPHLINRIWFRCECAGLFPVTRILSPRTIHNYDYNKFITTRVIFHRGRFLASTHLFDLYRKLGCVRTCERVFCDSNILETEKLPQYIVGRYRKMNCKSLRIHQAIYRSHWYIYSRF